MANIGKVFGWITRTLLGTKTPSNLDRGLSNQRDRDLSNMNSDSDESSVEISRFSVANSSRSNNTTNYSSRSLQSRFNTTQNDESTMDESFIAPIKRKVKRPIFESDSESNDDESNQKHSHIESESESESSDERNNDGDDERNADDFEADVLNVSNRISMLASIVNDSIAATEKRMSAESVIPETDDEEEEEENDENDDKNKTNQTDDIDRHELSQIHCFSPRTRRSITGRRSILPANTSDKDEEEDDVFFDSDDDGSSKDNKATAIIESSVYKSAESVESIEYDDDLSLKLGENSKRNRSVEINNSIASIRTPNPKRFSGIGTRGADSSDDQQQHRTSTPSIEFSDKSAASKSSDIEIHSSHSDLIKSYRRNDSVISLNSSDEENQQPLLNSTALPRMAGATAVTPTKTKLIQPKLPFDRKLVKTATAKNFVSHEYYQQKSNELAQLERELIENRNLLACLGHTLPDKGFNLERRCADLQRSFDKKQSELESYAIEEEHLDEVQFVGTSIQPKTERHPNSNNNNNSNDWRDELEAIAPIHTGKQGMATFNQQKALTLNRIEKLHKALEKCPAETDLASQPSYMSIQLMPHQLHAIKWMHWREKTKRPKGGLLADDMGLGKTLTTIGLVLHTMYGEDNSMAEADEDQATGSEEDSDDDDDDDVDRGHKKSYKHQGGTLIVCPASLINQWEHEIKNHVKRRKLTVLMHHGNKRNESAHSLCKPDVVITTYGIVSSDHKSNSVLFRVRWERIVLDEAHMIRNHSTAVSKACCALRAPKRWGLSGTPIQNKHMDVYSMLKFLRVTPFDDLPTFKKWINPNSAAGMSRLHNILKPLLLRRTKAELQIKGELQELPSKTIIIEDIELTPGEASIYTKILAYSQNLFAQYMAQHQQRNDVGKFQLDADIRRRLEQVKQFGGGQEVKSAQILILLLRLRQICDHPGLIHQMLQDECDMDDYDEQDADTLDMNIVKQMIGLKINEDDKEKEGNSSSASDAPASANILCASNKIYDFKNPSSKCKHSIEIIKRILRETHDKIVVVSQWTTFLSIVADLLHRERIHYVELTGKTPIKDRNDIVVSFNKPVSPERVMMLSLVAGGVGLNLTGANNLILLDPHWNPQLESQAFDRVYRVGQTKDVNIYKLLCKNTVEKKIQSIQESKLQLSENVLTGSKQSSGTKLSMQDMRKLFDM